MEQPFLLRPGAQPFSWKDLDPNQQEAFKKILDLIYEVWQGVNKTTDQEEQSYPWKIYKKRRDQVILLSGNRGTGKTSVMLSLIHAIRHSDKKLSDYPKDIKSKIQELQNTIFLEPLDMSSLPGPTNLLMAILTRLNKVAEEFGLSDSCREETENWFSLFDGLLTDVSLAWDGNLMERRGQLDPDAFAAELKRVEMARLGLNDRFHELLEKLSKDIKREKKTEPIFILPVDDVDLNPVRMLELFRLIHMITSPRLVTLFLASIDWIRDILLLKLEGDLQALAKDSTADSQLFPLDIDQFKAKCVELAGNAYRKLCPPSQCVYLKDVQIDLALTTSLYEGLESLGELLFQIPLSKNFDLLGIQSLGEFFLGTSEEKFKEYLENYKKSQKETFPWGLYSGIEIFRLPWRHLIDLILKLQDIIEKTAEKDRLTKFYEILFDSFLAVCEEDYNLPLENRKILSNILNLNFPEGFNLILANIIVKTVFYPRFELFLEPKRQEKSFTIQEFIKWMVYVKSGNGREYEISPKTASFLTLLHDFAILDSGNGKIFYMGGEGFPSDFIGSYSYITVRWHNLDLELHWVLGGLRTFWQQKRFSEIWKETIEKLNLDINIELEQEHFDSRVSTLCYCYIKGSLHVLRTPIAPFELNPNIFSLILMPLNPIEPELRNLAEDITKLLNDLNQNKTPSGTEGWLISLLVLLAPEYGIPKKTVDMLLTKELGEFYQSDPIRNFVRQTRYKGFETALRRNITKNDLQVSFLWKLMEDKDHKLYDEKLNEEILMIK